MGSCTSTPSTSTSHTKSKPPKTYQRTTTTTATKQTTTKKPVSQPKVKGPGRSLVDNTTEKATSSSLKEEDLKKLAGEAAMKRLQDKRAKDGKLGQNLEKEKLKSTQLVINDLLKRNLQERNGNDLDKVYD